jgi:hypothetical protein
MMLLLMLEAAVRDVVIEVILNIENVLLVKNIGIDHFRKIDTGLFL